MRRNKTRRNRQKKGNHIDESWLLPYSDLLTLLVALFIVLFAMSDIDAQKYKELAQIFRSEFSGGNGILEQNESPVEPPIDIDDDQEESVTELTQLQELQTAINNYISENSLAEVLATQLTDEGLLITILNDITFDSASAVVKSEGEEIAEEVAELLHTDPPRQIVISGHADDRPMNNREFGSNWELSVMRAVNFMSLILENNNLDPTRFSAKGYGEHQPVVPNSTEENRAKNRRVEVLVLPKYEIQTQERQK